MTRALSYLQFLPVLYMKQVSGLYITGMVMVPAQTDISCTTSAPSDPTIDPKCKPLDQNQPLGSPGFFAGNCKFITRKLWGFTIRTVRSCIMGS